ncbi:MAG: hypothetical protein WC602_06910, partial [archaeon]
SAFAAELADYGSNEEVMASTGASSVRMDSVSPKTDIDLTAFSKIELSFTPDFSIVQYTVEIWESKGGKIIRKPSTRMQIASCKKGSACPGFSGSADKTIRLTVSSPEFKTAVSTISRALASDATRTFCIRVEATEKNAPTASDWKDTECVNLAFTQQKPAAPQPDAGNCTILKCLAYTDLYKLTAIFMEDKQNVAVDKSVPPAGTEPQKGTAPDTAPIKTNITPDKKTGSATAPATAQTGSAPASASAGGAFSLGTGQSVKPFNDIKVTLTLSSDSWFYGKAANFKVYEGTGQIYCEGGQSPVANIHFNVLTDLVSSEVGKILGTSACYASAGTMTLFVNRSDILEGKTKFSINAQRSGKLTEVTSETGKSLADYIAGK